MIVRWLLAGPLFDLYMWTAKLQRQILTIDESVSNKKHHISQVAQEGLTVSRLDNYIHICFGEEIFMERRRARFITEVIVAEVTCHVSTIRHRKDPTSVIQSITEMYPLHDASMHARLGFFPTICWSLPEHLALTTTTPLDIPRTVPLERPNESLDVLRAQLVYQCRELSISESELVARSL